MEKPKTQIEPNQRANPMDHKLEANLTKTSKEHRIECHTKVK